MKNFFKIIYVSLILLGWGPDERGVAAEEAAASAARLQWQAWLLDKPITNIAIDDKGHMEVSYFRDGKSLPTKYYYMDATNTYRCAASLKEETGADCKNTCFPSYRQEGISFSLPIQNLEGCKAEKARGALLGEKYLGFKSESYRISCSTGEINLTLIPEFEKYSDFINKGGNTYFRSLLNKFQMKGLIAKVSLEDKQAQKTLKLYEIKDLSFNQNKTPITLPAEYLKIPFNAYMTKMETMGLRIGQWTAKKRAELSKSPEKKELSEIEEVCEMRFPAQADKAAIVVLCRQDSQIGAAFMSAEKKWQDKLNKEIVAETEKKLKEEGSKIIQSFCKK